MIAAALIIHISIALASVAYTTYLLVAPAESRFRIAYVLIGLTILTGTYLVLALPAHLTEVCITGLTYIGLVSVGIVAARLRLTKDRQRLR